MVFLLLDDREVELDWPEIEHVWMAADVMALLCETYSFSPEITPKRVENWQKKITDSWKAILAEYLEEWDDDEDKLYKNMMVSFDKLKEAARKFPPWFAGRISNPVSDGPAT